MKEITKVGFYNPHKPGDPMPSLTGALRAKREEVKDSLLVLPEAFNIGTSYSRQSKIQQDPRILSELQDLCTCFNICIVAGLIISSPTNPAGECYNSSYLVDSAGAGLFCHKMLSDNQGPYATCLDGCDGHNAIQYRNIAICSLVCMDGYECYKSERHNALERKMVDLRNAQYRILCIPAYIETMPPEFWGIPNSYRVVANAASPSRFPHSPGSFIDRLDEKRSAGRLLELERDDEPTCIKLWRLASHESNPLE